MYEAFKLWFPSLGVSKAVVLFFFGFGCQMFSVLVLRWPLRSFRTLAIGLAVSIAMEMLDAQHGSTLTKSLRDLMKVNAIPLALVLAARSGRLVVDDRSAS